MKKVIFALSLISICTGVLYACGKIDCDSVIDMNEDMANQTINKAYEQLMNKLNDELVKAYEDYQKAIEEQNELLEKVQILKERNTFLEKQILFLRSQDKELVGLSIDSISVKKGVDKP
jgi:predicted house-cleaning noncanonical NTP pyrophosphatase (MazG superfamily)